MCDRTLCNNNKTESQSDFLLVTRAHYLLSVCSVTHTKFFFFSFGCLELVDDLLWVCVNYFLVFPSIHSILKLRQWLRHLVGFNYIRNELSRFITNIYPISPSLFIWENSKITPFYVGTQSLGLTGYNNNNILEYSVIFILQHTYTKLVYV